MKENIEHCPICGGDDFSDYINCTDYSISKETFNIKKCNDCGFLFTSPRPDIDSIDKYYDSEEYISHSNESNNLINILYKFARHFTLKNKLSIVSKYTSNKSLLDYGCGTGHFLKTCKNNGWNVKGLEPNHTARQQALDTGLDVYDNLSSLAKFNFDIITLWHVLEHIHDLNFTFINLIDLLNTGGKLIIAVPNHQAKDAHIYQQHWAAYDLPRHLYHFNQQTMAKFLSKHNLKLLDVLPMKLDAFYVCMLSEKYKGMGLNLFNSFINACKSNIYASKNHNNYSSLIYIAEK